MASGIGLRTNGIPLTQTLNFPIYNKNNTMGKDIWDSGNNAKKDDFFNNGFLLTLIWQKPKDEKNNNTRNQPNIVRILKHGQTAPIHHKTPKKPTQRNLLHPSKNNKSKKAKQAWFCRFALSGCRCIAAAWKRGKPSEDGTQAVLCQRHNRETALGACPQIIAPASGIRPDWKDTSDYRLSTDANALPVCTALCFGRPDAACNHWYVFTEAALLRAVAACAKLLKNGYCLTRFKYI